MRKLTWLVVLVALGTTCGAASAQGPVTGYCTLGAKQAAVSGLNSTNYLQGIIRGCTVTVRLTGTTTPATLFSDASGTPLSNPFTANATTGQWLFYASTANLYDVVLSGGTAPNTYPAPVTLTGLQPGGGGGGGGFTPGGDLAGSSTVQTVIGLKGTPFCTGFTPTNGQFIELTTGSSPNPCWTAATASGATLPTATAPGQIISSTAAGTTYAVQGQVFYNQTGDTISSIEAECSSLCTYVVTSPITLTTTTHAMNSNVHFVALADGLLTVNGTSLTNVQMDSGSALTKHFAGSAAISFSPLVSSVPIEWFGGKADATGSVGVGTDNLAPCTAAHAAIYAGTIQFSNGGYRFSGSCTITKTNITLAGVTIGSPAPAVSIPSNSTILYIDSASATGPHFTSTASYGVIRNLAVLRTQTPTGTATGISVEAVGVLVKDVASEDSIRNIYYAAGSGSAGQGQTFNTSVGWGYTGLAGTPGVPVCGYYLDGSGTVGFLSIRFRDTSAGSNLGGAQTTTGLCAVGTNISDLSINHFESAQTNYGIDLENTGTTSFVAQDIQINDSILNGCLTACLKANGLQSSGDLAPHLLVQGGNFFPTGTGSVGALFHNSSGIGMTGVQILPGGSGVTNISLDTVEGFTVTNNMIDGLDFGSGVGISCLNSTKGTISNNQIKEYMSGTGIKNVGCTLVSEQGNSIAAPTGGTLGTGITFDSGSSNNGPWSLNNIDAATVTTPVSDAGTNNNTMRPTSLVAGNVTDSALTPGNCVQAGTAGILTTTAGACGSGGSGPTLQTNTVNNASQALLNFTTSTANSVGLTATPVNTSGGIEKIEITGGSYTGNAATSTTATNIAGGALGSAPYQSAANATAFIASPTTSGHTFFYGWQPSGSAIAPAAIDGATYLASPPAIGGTTPAAVTGTIVSGKNEIYALATGTATSSTNFGSAGYLADSSYWDGTTAQVDRWVAQGVVATGTNPKSSFYISHTGTPSSSAVMIDALVAPALNICPDTSGSGTAQSCSTAGAQTLGVFVTNMCVVYTTTTTNSGAALTLNIDGLGAKSIAIPGASGWTTTLTAGIIPANKPLQACYDGTNWNVQQTGTVASGGSSAFSAITAGTNTAALVEGTGGSITRSGTGIIDANQINSATVPASASLLGTNGSSQTVAATGHAIAVPLTCADISASGTAQSCTTSPSFTPAANDCIIYTTTTANTGTGLTLNVNSLGAKSVAKWLGSTTLAAGDVAANSPQLACYNGTVWNLSTIGNAPSGGGTPAYPILITGGVSGGVVYGNDATHLTVSPAGTATHFMLWGGAGTAPQTSTVTESGGTDNFGSNAITTTGALGGHTLTINGAQSINSQNFFTGSAFQSTGTKFTTSGCSVSASTGGPSAGVFTLGANSCTVVITPGVAANNGWSCDAHDRTNLAALIGGESSSTTTTASITIPVTAGATDVISFSCTAY